MKKDFFNKIRMEELYDIFSRSEKYYPIVDSDLSIYTKRLAEFINKNISIPSIYKYFNYKDNYVLFDNAKDLIYIITKFNELNNYPKESLNNLSNFICWVFDPKFAKDFCEQLNCPYINKNALLNGAKWWKDKLFKENDYNGEKYLQELSLEIYNELILKESCTLSVSWEPDILLDKVGKKYNIQKLDYPPNHYMYITNDQVTVVKQNIGDYETEYIIYEDESNKKISNSRK